MFDTFFSHQFNPVVTLCKCSKDDPTCTCYHFAFMPIFCSWVHVDVGSNYFFYLAGTYSVIYKTEPAVVCCRGSNLDIISHGICPEAQPFSLCLKLYLFTVRPDFFY